MLGQATPSIITPSDQTEEYDTISEGIASSDIAEEGEEEGFSDEEGVFILL